MTLLDIALGQYGVTEVPGIENNPQIMSYFRETGHNWVQGDETSWCSAFVNWCAQKAEKESSGQLTARSWLKVGEEVYVPKTGDLVVLWRDKIDSWKGHVGIYINSVNTDIHVLGGNQNNRVQISPYPAVRVISYRRI